MENSERFGGLTRFGSNPAPRFNQFRAQNLSIPGGENGYSETEILSLAVIIVYVVLDIFNVNSYSGHSH